MPGEGWLPPYLVTPPPRCAFLLDRHTHKNGGSTMRQVYRANDMLDQWVYWGYGGSQHRGVALRASQLLAAATANGTCSLDRPVRLLGEYHYSRPTFEQVLSSFGPRSVLQALAPSCGCRVVLVTRLREPLSFYSSFYRWTVCWCQQLAATAHGANLSD